MALTKLKNSEKRQRRDHEQICEEFCRLKEEYPNEAASALMNSIATDFGYTPYGVRVILIKNGVYTPRKTQKQKEYEKANTCTY